MAENRFATFPLRRKAVYTEVFLNSVPTLGTHSTLVPNTSDRGADVGHMFTTLMIMGGVE